MSTSPVAVTAPPPDWPRPTDRRATAAVIACGAVAQPCTEIIQRRGWDATVHPLPPLLHNRPELIASQVESLASRLRRHTKTIAVAYADCGTYGALDEVCNRLGMRRLRGLHCYDVFAGPDRLNKFFAEQPGTYLLTDFLVRAFQRVVVDELGLRRHPELRDSYFGNYSQVVWLAQRPDPELKTLADEAAKIMGLPLVVVDVGTAGLERELAELLSADGSD
jgi:Protein of unknown function (DUF1638)